MHTFKFRPVFSTDTAISSVELPPADDSDTTLDEAAAFQEEVAGVGHNRPPETEPVETSYKPHAHNEDELLAEAREVADELVKAENSLRTTTTSKLTRVCADIIALGSPELKANFPDIQAIGETFKDRKQLRAAIRATAKRYLGDEVYALPTTQSLMTGAVNMACLLAYGYACMAFFPLKVSIAGDDGKPRRAVIDRHAIGKLTLGSDDDAEDYAPAIAVAYNVYAPTIWKQVPRPGGKGALMPVAGTAHPNKDESPYFLTPQVAGWLYSLYIDHEPTANFLWDDDGAGRSGAGFVLGKKRTTGGTQAESTETVETKSTEESGDKTSDTSTDPLAKTGFINPRYAMIKLLDDLPALEAGDTIPMGIIHGLYKWATEKPNGQINPVFFAQLGGMAEAMVTRMLEMFEEGKPSYSMLKAWARLGETIQENIRLDDGGEIVEYRPLGMSSKNDWQRIGRPQVAEKEMDDELAEAIDNT